MDFHPRDQLEEHPVFEYLSEGGAYHIASPAYLIHVSNPTAERLQPLEIPAENSEFIRRKKKAGYQRESMPSCPYDTPQLSSDDRLDLSTTRDTSDIFNRGLFTDIENEMVGSEMAKIDYNLDPSAFFSTSCSSLHVLDLPWVIETDSE